MGYFWSKTWPSNAVSSSSVWGLCVVVVVVVVAVVVVVVVVVLRVGGNGHGFKLHLFTALGLVLMHLDGGSCTAWLSGAKIFSQWSLRVWNPPSHDFEHYVI